MGGTAVAVDVVVAVGSGDGAVVGSAVGSGPGAPANPGVAVGVGAGVGVEVGSRKLNGVGVGASGLPNGLGVGTGAKMSGEKVGLGLPAEQAMAVIARVTGSPVSAIRLKLARILLSVSRIRPCPAVTLNATSTQTVRSRAVPY